MPHALSGTWLREDFAQRGARNNPDPEMLRHVAGVTTVPSNRAATIARASTVCS